MKVIEVYPAVWIKVTLDNHDRHSYPHVITVVNKDSMNLGNIHKVLSIWGHILLDDYKFTRNTTYLMVQLTLLQEDKYYYKLDVWDELNYTKTIELW